jgi:predicted DNA-binding ribbon-helix-helix protein
MTTISTIGSLVYFRGSNIWIKPAAAESLFHAYGISKKVPDLSENPVSRIRFIIRNFGRSGIRAEEVTGTASKDSIEVGILERQQVSAHEMRWVQVDHLAWSAAHGFSDPDTDLGREFIEQSEKALTHLDYYWVRSVLLDLVKDLKAFTLGGGGIYYVHSDMDADLDNIRAMARSIPGARLHTIRVDPADDESRASIGDAAVDSLTGSVSDIVAKLDAWREKASGRTSTLEKMLEELAEIQGRAVTLSTALRFHTDEIEAAVAQAAAAVQDALTVATAPDEPAQDLDAASGEEPAQEDPPTAEEPAEVEVILDGDGAHEPEAVNHNALIEELETCSVTQLRKIARKNGISGYSKMTQAQLVTAILDAREEAATA